MKNPPSLKTGDEGWYPVIDHHAAHLPLDTHLTLYHGPDILAKLAVDGIALFRPGTVPGSMFDAILWPTTPELCYWDALEDEWEIYHARDYTCVLLHCRVVAAARCLYSKSRK